MTGSLRVLIVGGYGTFGGRIVELLEDEPRLELIVAGRSLARARAFCAERGPRGARLVPAAFERGRDPAAQLAQHRPDLVADASGPFQSYGHAPYALVDACIAVGADYLDLADGSEFVAGIPAYDGVARAAGRFALSGVSSFPVLTAAVVRDLAEGLARIDTIHAGIAPSPYAGVGRNVIRAVAGYAGRRALVRRGGRDAVARPFTEQMRFTIAPPGRLPLESRLFSLVDTPDLRALAALWPEAREIWTGAAPAPELLHRALIGLAWLVRLGLLPGVAALAPLMQVASNRLRWGEHRGGMFVAVTGADLVGTPVRRSWHLIAEGDDGPLIPSMAVAAIVRRVLAGQAPTPGARAAVRELELEDYDALFATRAIFTGCRDDASAEQPLYGRLLGAAWHDLPAEIRALHEVRGTSAAEGRAVVERGGGRLACIVADAVGFPDAAAEVPVSVTFTASEGGEIWLRRFGERWFSSRQLAGSGRSEHLLLERFGPLCFAIALVAEGGRLSLVLRGWRAFGVPLPRWLGPRAVSYESAEDGRFRFDVAIAHPLTGPIVRYRGWLVPARRA